jgi:hypothetical protein
VKLFWIGIASGGIFSIVGALFNWDWFMKNSRARGMVDLLGREGARVFYGLLGVFLLVLSIIMVLSMS